MEHICKGNWSKSFKHAGEMSCALLSIYTDYLESPL